MINYESEMSTKIQQLNNDTGKMTEKYEELEQKKNYLKSKIEETRNQKWDQISELSQVFQAIDNLDFICSQKPEGGVQGGLNYQANAIFTHLPKCPNIDYPNKSYELAKGQLRVIERYLRDFKQVIVKFNTDVAPALN